MGFWKTLERIRDSSGVPTNVEKAFAIERMNLKTFVDGGKLPPIFADKAEKMLAHNMTGVTPQLLKEIQTLNGYLDRLARTGKLYLPTPSPEPSPAAQIFPAEAA